MHYEIIAFLTTWITWLTIVLRQTLSKTVKPNLNNEQHNEINRPIIKSLVEQSVFVISMKKSALN